MEFLGIGPLEFLLIIIIALIIFSPKDLAKGGREIGRLINRLAKSDTWKSMRQVSREMQNLPSRLAREAQLEELKELEKEINRDAGSLYDDRPIAPASSSSKEAIEKPPTDSEKDTPAPLLPSTPADKPPTPPDPKAPEMK